MVRWFDPHQLVDTALRVFLSGLFSAYADHRELQALAPTDVPDRSQGDECWIDYVADLGDGWNPSYTVARLLARERLDVDWEGEQHATERGRILVMGGDQVYPVPKAAEYENRMLGPYRSALPCPRAGTGAPELFAIPGSHDWYDGLVNFTSVFCRRRRIGGWQTHQRRSYFAVKLPNRWWIWGIDIQFGSYIDEAQLLYFAAVARDDLAPGDHIILCLAKEVESGRKQEEIHSDRDVEYLEREIVEPRGARVAIHLKSGKHYYARYEEEDEDGARQHITSGGGGAFLHPTHNLPDRMPMDGPDGPVPYRRAATYPSPAVSRGLRKRIWLLAPYNLPLAGLFGMVQVLLAFMLSLHLDGRHERLGFGDLRRALWESPTAFLLILLMIVSLAGMVRFAHDANGVGRFALGLAHSALQLASVAGVLIAASRLSTTAGLHGVSSLLVFLALVWLLGGIGGTVGMSGYLWATNCLGFHGNEGYAPLHHQDLKHFLRLHIGVDGVLTVYPIAVDRVGREWHLSPDAPAHEPWFAPSGPEPGTRLIEAPVRITKRDRFEHPGDPQVSGTAPGAPSSTARVSGSPATP